MSNSKNFNNVINSRFIRWILLLQNYDLEIKFRPSKLAVGADMLSRLPLEVSTEIEEESLGTETINLFNDNVNQKISIEEVKCEMSKCSISLMVKNYIINGWPSKKPDNIKKFYEARLSLDVYNECIFYGDRLFVPMSLRQKFLDLIHREHVGIVKSKQIARKCIW